jgi:Zn-dependent protease with chaperone function
VLQPLLMVCFLAVFLRDAIGEPWLGPWVTHGQAAAISLGLMASIAVAVHALIWRHGRLLSRTGRGREVRRADLTVGAAWLGATLVHVFNVLALGWLDAVRSVVGDVVILDEALAILPVVLVIIAAWWSLFPIDRRVREAGLIRDLDEGRTVYPQLTRGGFVLMSVRHQLAIILVPILLVMGWSELVDWGAGRWFGILVRAQGGASQVEAITIVLVQAAGTLVVFTLLPPIMRRIWDTEPLGASRIRERLDELCRRHGVRNRELLVWKTQGTMINGAVMGLFAPVRYIMLTDSLLDHLSDRQVEAVMAHEVGHVRRRHMVWLVVAMIAAIGCVISGAGLVLQALPLPSEVLAMADVPTTLAALSAALVLFGFVSRRFEWQADAFAVQHLSQDQPVPSPTITPDAVAAMTGALQAVADLNHIPPDRFGWRHGSISARQERLAGMVGLPVDQLPIDRQARRVKILAGAGLLAVAALAAAEAFWPGTMSP